MLLLVEDRDGRAVGRASSIAGWVSGRPAVSLVVGFATIIAVVALGALLAQLRVLDLAGQRMLAEVAFYVATPALMLLTISRVDLDAGLTGNVVASLGSLLMAGGSYAVMARLVWHRAGGDIVIGALASSYVNAGNLGIAVAAYVVGETSVVVPTLLVQLLLVQPLALVYLDRRAGGASGRQGRVVRRLLSNPLTLASAAGVVLAATGWRLPDLVRSPLELLAGLAIPAMLLAYGVALRLSPPVGSSGHNGEVVTATVLKLLVQPALAWLIGVVCGLEGVLLLGVVITAGLPTAQNIFLHATRYRRAEDLARETILVTTLLSLPVALTIAFLLG
jgi:malonate transporter